MFSKRQLVVIKYCAEEVERQQAEPTAVYWMLDAWNYVSSRLLFLYRSLYQNSPTNSKDSLFDLVKEIGKRVEPYKNANGFRTVAVRVGARVCPPAYEVPRLIEQLCKAVDTLSPEEFYKEFEEIHPFCDGNGRTGKILYNILKGTLFGDNVGDPQMPPNFWNITNP